MAIIKSTSYNIYVGDKSFDELNKFLKKQSYTKYIIICDENSLTHCLPKLLFNSEALNQAEIIELESGEENKTLETCAQVWGALTDIGIDKKSLIINLGGGVISDLGGFVASVFKRGVHFINIPTTLLSMVDASVGGKTGIDFNGIKNHIGTITEPKAVFVNPVFLETLSLRQIKNGYAEVIKIALISDAAFWQVLKKLKNSIQFRNEEIITKAIELKNIIVKKDLHEENIRKSLNFGHSIGHTLESALIQQQKDILHGEAVAAGIIMESQIAYQQKRISKKECDEICLYIQSIYSKIRITKETQTFMLEYIKHDKKNEAGILGLALPKSIGTYELSFETTTAQIKAVIENY